MREITIVTISLMDINDELMQFIRNHDDVIGIEIEDDMISAIIEGGKDCGLSFANSIVSVFKPGIYKFNYASYDRVERGNLFDNVRNRK